MITETNDLLHDHASHPHAFPRLTTGQLDRLTSYATCERFKDGAMLFREGDADLDMFVVTEGRVEIVRDGGGPSENGGGPSEDDGGGGGSCALREAVVVARHEAGEFTGEMSMVSGQPAIASARALGDVKVLRLGREALGKVIASEGEVGDVILRALLARREILEERGYHTLLLVGSRWSRETFELKDFLARNRVLYRWEDPDASEGIERMLRGLGVGPEALPVVLTDAGEVLRRPAVAELAKSLGVSRDVDGRTFDVVVVGAGPAGLAAAVYGASEGLSTLVVEAVAPGGQAGTSSRIENYLGFPTGISGSDLASAARTQALKFGATLTSSTEVRAVDCAGVYKSLAFADGQDVTARTVILATGASYRRLDADDFERFEQGGIYYGATHVEAVHCAGSDVVVVGGGNSAGQAAVFLSGHARQVNILIRGDSLAGSMSRYLISRIEQTPNITLRPGCQVTACHGGESLERVTVTCRDGGSYELETPALFCMTGAEPRTGWLNGCVALDAKGFIVTGAGVDASAWRERRPPFPLETSTPGIFAAGDCRAGSVKRVAAAVGEGSMSVSYVHAVLAG